MFHTKSEMAAFVNILYVRSPNAQPEEVAGPAEEARLFKKKWGEKFTIGSGHWRFPEFILRLTLLPRTQTDNIKYVAWLSQSAKQYTKTGSWICKYYFIVLSQFCPLIQLYRHKSPHRSPLRRYRAGLRAMDAFVIKFMTASFYYFLRLAYKTQEGKWNAR